MKKPYLLLMLFLFALQLFTQAQTLYNQTPEFLKGNSIWAFSHKAGLDFNSGTGVAIASEMPDKGLGEGAASVCDRNTGDLLFYTNGETIWNANNQPMPHGDTLFGNGSGVTGSKISARQGALIVPFIEDTNKYYVFSLNNVDQANPAFDPQVFVNDNGDTIRGSLFYSVVDMTLENGLGNVVAGQKNILLDSTALGEAMIAIPGVCNSVWLLVHTAGPPLSNDPPQYKAYEITASGINTTPVISSGKVHATRSWLAVSPDKSTIAITGGGQNISNTIETGLEVARFDIQTGEVNQAIVIEDFDNTPLPSSAQFAGGCSFSPDGNMLYYDIGNYFDTFYLMQCDLSNFDSTAIANSRTRIAANPPNNTLPEFTNFGGGFRLYNDTVYIAGHLNGGSPPYYISRINSPNNPGLACNYEREAILLFPISYPAGSTLGSESVFVSSADTVINTRDTLICKGWNPGVRLAPTQANGMYYTWNDNSTDSVLTIDQGGTYWVNYYTEDCNLFYSDTFHITEGTMQQPVITVDVHVLSTTLTYSTYQWLLNDVAINGATQQDYTVQENGFYRVVVTNEQGCVDTSDAYEVTNVSIDDVRHLAQQIQVWPNPVKEEAFVRSPVPVKLSLSSISGKVIQQQVLSNSLSMRELAAGMYLLRISDKEGRLLKVEKLIKAKE